MGYQAFTAREEAEAVIRHRVEQLTRTMDEAVAGGYANGDKVAGNLEVIIGMLNLAADWVRDEMEGDE